MCVPASSPGLFVYCVSVIGGWIEDLHWPKCGGVPALRSPRAARFPPFRIGGQAGCVLLQVVKLGFSWEFFRLTEWHTNGVFFISKSTIWAGSHLQAWPPLVTWKLNLRPGMAVTAQWAISRIKQPPPFSPPSNRFISSLRVFRWKEISGLAGFPHLSQFKFHIPPPCTPTSTETPLVMQRKWLFFLTRPK